MSKYGSSKRQSSHPRILLIPSVLMFGHVLSPVLGGILTHFFGYRSIFGFQVVFGGLALCLVGLFLPETLRNIAGNGTIKLNAYQQPLVALIRSSHDARFNSNPETIILPPTIKSFVEPLNLLTHMDLLGSIIFGAIAFATAVVVISTTALCLESYFGFSTILIGVAFLPSAVGTILGFFVISYLLERDYKIVESHYKTEQDIEEDSNLSFKNNSDFPTERARLRNIWWITLHLRPCGSPGRSWRIPSSAATWWAPSTFVDAVEARRRWQRCYEGQRHRRHRALPQTRPEPVPRRLVPRHRARRRRLFVRLHQPTWWAHSPEVERP